MNFQTTYFSKFPRDPCPDFPLVARAPGARLDYLVVESHPPTHPLTPPEKDLPTRLAFVVLRWNLLYFAQYKSSENKIIPVQEPFCPNNLIFWHIHLVLFHAIGFIHLNCL